MKRKSIFLGLMTAGLIASAQVRTSLYEEFTGENCNPCAQTNPGLNTVLLANPTLVIPIKWQVPIPSAPSATWSLYKTDQAEIDWRWKSTAAGAYGYPSQNTPTDAVTSGINSAPSGRFDGQHQWTFGATSDHPFYVSNAVIASAQSQTTNFSIAMTPSWSPTFTNCVVSVTVTSSTSFTSVGALMFRLCLVERVINFPTAPGSNGEKDFYDAVRKSYPTSLTGTAVTSMGTALSATWAPAQTQTFTVSCNIPNYINDYGQMAFVGFVQDDGNKKVYQASRTAQPSIPNEAKAIAANVTSIVCTGTAVPTVDIKNNGNNAITALTITPYLDGAAGTPVTWTGNLAVGATTNIPMSAINPTVGPHTYSYNITGVSGGDLVNSNNTKSTNFLSSISYFPGPVSEGFEGGVFPANWTVFNFDGNPNTFVRSTLASGYGTGAASVLYQVNSTSNGDTDDMLLPPTDLSAISNPLLKFDLSYCQVSTSNTDSLKVYTSKDCGTTWDLLYANGGTSMATAPTNSVTFFVPTASQWTTVSLSMPTYSNAAQVLVRFRGKSNKGNRMFLDNINLMLDPSTSINSVKAMPLSFDVYPNPAGAETNLMINSADNVDAKVSVTNALGQTVYSKQHNIGNGSNTIKIDCKNFAEGVYIINLETSKNASTRKLIISK